MSDIFLSYTKEDKARILPIVKLLEERGWTVWWDLNIPPGSKFSKVIQEAINSSSCVIVLWSENSISSEWVEIEAEEGREKGILIPVYLDDVKVPFQFKLIEGARLEDWDGDSAHPELISLYKSIAAVTGKEPIDTPHPKDPQIPPGPENGDPENLWQKFTNLLQKLRHSIQISRKFWFSAIRIFIILVAMLLIVWGSARLGFLRPILEPAIRMVNHLENPVSIYIDGSYRGRLDADASKFFYVEEFPVEVSFTTIRSTTTAGNSIGDYMTGSWSAVERWESIQIEATIASKMFFYPVVTNELETDCTVTVNEGYKAENSPGAVIGRSKTVQFGYYQLFKNSNILFICKDGKNYWWGDRVGQNSEGTPLYQMLEGRSGILRITLK